MVGMMPSQRTAERILLEIQPHPSIHPLLYRLRTIYTLLQYQTRVI